MVWAKFFVQRKFSAVWYVVNSSIYLLFYSPFSVSVEFVVFSASDIVGALRVELLAMVMVGIVVTSVVAIIIEECSKVVT